MYYAEGPIPGTEGISQDALNLLPHLWFDTAINCLHMSGFMARPSLPALQAICILPLIAPTFGASAYMTTLLHTALGLARELGFHNLIADTPTSNGQGSIRRELGRRIWACLSVAESLDPAAIAPGALIYPEARTDLPTNIDDDDMFEGDPVVANSGNHATGASHLIAMTRLSRICRAQSFSLKGVTSLSKRWSIAREYDEELSHVLDFCLELNPSEPLNDRDSRYDSKLGWIDWSRFMWVLTLWKLRLMFYRSFFGRSYSEPKYALAREVCVVGARKIMAAWERPRLPRYTKPWPVCADTIYAGMTLATEYLRGSHDQEIRSALRQEAEQCIEILRTNSDTSNAVVPRGVELLRQILKRGDSNATPEIPAIYPAQASGQVGNNPAQMGYSSHEERQVLSGMHDHLVTVSTGDSLSLSAPTSTAALNPFSDDFSFFTDLVQTWGHMANDGPSTGLGEGGAGGGGGAGGSTFEHNYNEQGSDDIWNALFFSMSTCPGMFRYLVYQK